VLFAGEELCVIHASALGGGAPGNEGHRVRALNLISVARKGGRWCPP
jgi:hypothetical protein